MKMHFPSLRTAILAAVSVTTLAGCQLYFGEENGGGGGFVEPGFACVEDDDCAAGCFCGEDGTCEEAGFCTEDSQCADGFTCDEARGSCEPTTCTTSAECPAGQSCQDGQCTATCSCTNDTQAIDQGFGYCDESRETCEPGVDPAGLCTGEVTCNEQQPNCEVGTTAAILDGCYTGGCLAIAQCNAPPVCENLQHVEDCEARSTGSAPDCLIVATGTNCTKPDGSICNPGDTNCTCQNFQFHSCDTRGAVPEN